MLMREEKIFNNWFTLNYSQRSVQEKFREKQEREFIYFNKWFAFMMLLAAIAASIVNIILRDKSDTLSFRFVKFCSWVVNFLVLVIFIVCCWVKNVKVLIWMHYINYVLFIFSAANFRYPIVNFVYSSSGFLMILFLNVEILYRLTWVIYNMLSFFEYVFLNLACVTIIWVYLYTTSDPVKANTTVFNFISYSIQFLLITGLGHIIQRQSKIAFYYQIKSQNQMDEYEEIFTKILSGFVKVENSKVKYMNSVFLNYVKRFFKSGTPVQTENLGLVIRESSQNLMDCSTYDKETKIFIESILTGLKFDSIKEENIRNMIEEYKLSQKSLHPNETCLERLLTYLPRLSKSNSLVYIGNSSIPSEEGSSLLEIYIQNEYEGNATPTDYLLLIKDISYKQSRHNDLTIN